ncbi:MoaE-domain-containing protein [Gloeophyllum trabeum ATCC 11539]|uniref:MoaE-domain-containing protein n=1 Tax=Gloeophyllum trabeum (strain ATCC 11539 / FP-39264 / Madison 617) TaxID=670483 RepID=S7QM26_GLOTA|nr:MoaE-domain-containing protein [Gloeophyllum trabeum ATCC 11539]EPQ60621.1 MoaE-domain-containing protein [Gloeophyllum trabeum ATCC 11539]
MSLPIPSSASVDARHETDHGVAVLTHCPLDTQAIIDSVADDGAGATAVFIGTTRNTFQGKIVTKLEYQAYSKLAIKTMSSILNRTSFHLHLQDVRGGGFTRMAIHHRLGTVPVGQPSIVIAVSAPHRKEAFEACEWALEQVKKEAQIWKREYYDGEKEEDAEWKANA